MNLAFNLNGTTQKFDIPDDWTLLDLLREAACLLGAKPGCQIGRCGACMVMLDGEAVNACLVPAWRLPGGTVVTPEALDAAALRQALAEAVAFQCGYCAPGITVSLAALLTGPGTPDEEAVRTALEGHVCRCTGYHSILRGAMAAIAAR